MALITKVSKKTMINLDKMKKKYQIPKIKLIDIAINDLSNKQIQVIRMPKSKKKKNNY